MRQIWRPHDTITIADNVPGKVLGVSFTTKSVRAFISGAPEWVHCDLIESHSTARGGDADEVSLIDELQKKLSFANGRIEALQEHIKELEEKLGRNYSGDLLRNVNVILTSTGEKKKRIERLEGCMQQILATLEKMGVETEQEE